MTLVCLHRRTICKSYAWILFCRKYLPENITHCLQYIPFEGKQDLEKNITD